jgi:hypothetical protein
MAMISSITSLSFASSGILDHQDDRHQQQASEHEKNREALEAAKISGADRDHDDRG